MAGWGLLTAVLAVADVTLTPSSDRIRIEIDGRLFSEYVYRGAAKPYLYPICAADGTPLTRGYPQENLPGEEHDHPHQHSLWFAHGSVDGRDFWREIPKTGAIVHDALLEATSGAAGIIRTRNRWMLPEGTQVCTEERKIRVQPVPGGCLLDFEVTLQAGAQPLVMGDSSEGAMAIRLVQWMCQPHQFEKKDVAGAGHAVNSEGQRDAAAWGQRAAWVDCFAPHNGGIYGVALFDHPRNPRHPPWWHVRDYGLLSANPFGEYDFAKKPAPPGSAFTIPAGGSATFRYRFYFHSGDTAAAGVAGQFSEYAAEP